MHILVIYLTKEPYRQSDDFMSLLNAFSYVFLALSLTKRLEGIRIPPLQMLLAGLYIKTHHSLLHELF